MVFLANSLIVLLLTSCAVLAQDPKCVMRGACDKQGFGPIPCLYDGPPQAVTDDSAKKTLQEICPHLANEAGLCCDSEQINELKNSFELYGLFLRECPSCFVNYQKVICHLYCSPKQTAFTKTIRTGKSEDGKDQMLELDYFIHEAFANSLYDSCKNVTRFGNRIIDAFCKPWEADKCNPLRMLKYLGADLDHHGHHPFQIDFVISSTDAYVLDGVSYAAVNEKGFKCSESAAGEPACACVHCPEVC